MTVLLVGEVNNFSADNLISSFPDEKLIVLGKLEKSSKKIREIDINTFSSFEWLCKTYNIREVVYCSDTLNEFNQGEDEIKKLRVFLEGIKKIRRIKMIYLTGPDVNFRNETSRSIVMKSAEELCYFYAEQCQFSLKILRSLYTYNISQTTSRLGQLIAKDQFGEEIDFVLNPEQLAYYIYPNDLFSLCYRIFDNWDYQFECLSVPDVFHIRYSDILEKLNLSKRSLFFIEYPLFELGDVSTSQLKDQYGWFPKVSILDELQNNVTPKSRRQTGRKEYLLHVYQKLGLQKNYVKIVELILLFFISEALSHILSQQVYFKVVDFRLFFILVIGLNFGIAYGLLAALLASSGLVFQNVSAGNNIMTLFFEPLNWISYIIYIVSGLVSGAVKENKLEELTTLKLDNANLEGQLNVERQFIEDLLVEKTELTHQILGRDDSYGKIYQFLKQLDVPYLDVFTINLLHYLSEVFGTDAIFVYSVEKGELGKRQLGIEVNTDYFTKGSQQFDLLQAQIAENQIWVNHRLKENLPAYMSSLTYKGHNEFYIIIQEVSLEKMNLYHQNLFKVLTNLANMSYQRINSKQSFLEGEHLIQKLETLRSLGEHRFAGEVLTLHLTRPESLNHIHSKMTIFDTFGQVGGKFYLVINTRYGFSIQEWTEYLMKSDIQIQMAESIEDAIENIQFDQMVS